MKSITLRRDSDHSILAELRQRGFSQHDFLERIPARKAKSDISAAAVTKDILFQGKPMLYIDVEGGFVDASLFSDLETISIADQSKKHFIVGATKKDIPFDILVRFLITADVVCTYIHMESQMEISFPSSRRAEVRGTHTYFTNEENIEPFAFVLEQDHTNTIHCLELSK